MEVTTGAGQEAEFAAHARQHCHLLRRLLAVGHLDTAAAGLGEIAQQATNSRPSKAVVPWVRQYRQASSVAQPGDCRGEGRPMPLGIAQLTGPQPLAKSFAAIAYVTGVRH